MASYSLAHYFNKYFQRIVEKLRENVIPSQNVKGRKTTKINSILPFHVTIICNTRISHAAALYAVKINALYTLLVQFNVALKCFTVQLQKLFNKDFPLFDAQKGC